MHFSGDLQAENTWFRKGYYMTGESVMGILPNWGLNYKIKKGGGKGAEEDRRENCNWNIIFYLRKIEKRLKLLNLNLNFLEKYSPTFFFFLFL